VGLVEKPKQILVSAVARGDLFVVPYVIASILERRIEAGVNPQGIAAKVFDVVKLFDYPRNVADTVAVES